MKTIYDREAQRSEQGSICVFTWESPDKQLMLELPEGFHEMEKERREGNYPLFERPEIILEDEEEKVQLTLQFFDKPMKKEDTKEAVWQIYVLMKEFFMQYPKSPVYLNENDGIPVGWFMMHMNNMGKEHMKAVFPIKGKMTLLTLTYPEKESVKWRAFTGHLLASIQEV